MESTYVDDIHYKAARREDFKQRFDDTKESRREVDTERITETKSHVAQTEEPERQIYPKEHDIGRIIIDEIPDKKPRKYLKYPSDPKSTKVTATREHVMETPRPHEKEDVIKIGKLDLYKLETRQVESRRIADRPSKEPERVERPRKACVKYFTGSMEKSYKKLRTISQYNSIYCIFIFYSTVIFVLHIFIIPPYSEIDSNISTLLIDIGRIRLSYLNTRFIILATYFAGEKRNKGDGKNPG